MINKRTAFVDYFFRRYYNPLRAGEYLIDINKKLEKDKLRQDRATQNAEVAFLFIQKLYQDNIDNVPKEVR